MDNSEPPVKPGVRTSEFWLACAVAFFAAASAVFTNNQWAQLGGIMAAALASAGYGWSRGTTKRPPAGS